MGQAYRSVVISRALGCRFLSAIGAFDPLSSLRNIARALGFPQMRDCLPLPHIACCGLVSKHVGLILDAMPRFSIVAASSCIADPLEHLNNSLSVHNKSSSALLAALQSKLGPNARFGS